MNLEQVAERLWPDPVERASALEKRRKLFKISISEISAVDKPANKHANALILKRDGVPRVEVAPPQKDERVRQLEAREGKKKKAKRVRVSAVAKVVLASGAAGVDPALFAEGIAKRAEKIRRPDETPQQAYARCIMHDSKGVDLFKALKASSGQSRGANDVSQAELTGYAAPKFRSREEAELDRLARRHQNRNPGMTFEAAYTAIYTAPENKALVAAVRNAGLVRELRGQGGVL